MNSQHQDERSHIREAMDRLLLGQAAASGGSLTAAALAAEAGGPSHDPLQAARRPEERVLRAGPCAVRGITRRTHVHDGALTEPPT